MRSSVARFFRAETDSVVIVFRKVYPRFGSVFAAGGSSVFSQEIRSSGELDKGKTQNLLISLSPADLSTRDKRASVFRSLGLFDQPIGWRSASR
jgi:hypothetical protein